MLSMILAESALEPIPKELLNHPSVKKHALRRGKRPEELLLDRSIHHSAMKGIKGSERRGRPDLVHIALLSITCTPLYDANQLRVFVHTVGDEVVAIGENVRLPKSYVRFASLMEQLYIEKDIDAGGKTLLSLQRKSFEGLVEEIGSDLVVGLSRRGSPSDAERVAVEATGSRDACIVIGGFPRGSFSENVLGKVDSLRSIHRTALEAHVVISRIIYECENALKI